MQQNHKGFLAEEVRIYSGVTPRTFDVVMDGLNLFIEPEYVEGEHGVAPIDVWGVGWMGKEDEVYCRSLSVDGAIAMAMRMGVVESQADFKRKLNQELRGLKYAMLSSSPKIGDDQYARRANGTFRRGQFTR